MKYLSRFFGAHKLFWIPLGACMVVAVAFYLFLEFGGVAPSSVSLQAASATTYGYSQQLTPACRATLNAGAAVEAPVQQQLQAIGNRLNEIGFDLSSFVPVGQTRGLDTLAGKVSSGEEEEVQQLEEQYSSLDSQLQLLQSRYRC